MLGLRGRRADARDGRGGGDPARAPAGAARARRQRRRPDAPAAGRRASARPARRASSTRCSPPDRPVIFAYHGYPWLIHRLTYRRTNHDNIHVRGYKEEGTTTTPFDMVMLNDMDRFHLVMDVIDRVPGLGTRAPRAAPGDGRRAAAAAPVHARARRRRAGGARLDAAGPRRRRASEPAAGIRPERGARPHRQHRVEQRQAAAARRRTTGSLGEHEPTRRGAGVDAGRAGAALERARATPTPSAHRIVHGGERAARPARIDDGAASRSSRALTPLAPLHQPKALAAVARSSAALPGVPAVACFDTAFHARLPRGGGHLRAAGRVARALRRCAATASTASRTPTRRAAATELLGCRTARAIVTCHLGAGASLAAVRDGRVGRHHDGLHAARGARDGDALGQRRPGPGALAGAAGARARRRCTTRSSAARGCSGSPARRTCARCSRATTATRGSRSTSTCTGWRRGVAAMAAALGGLDALVFTGGVGEQRRPCARAQPSGWRSSASRWTRAQRRRDGRRRSDGARRARTRCGRGRARGRRDGPPGARGARCMTGPIAAMVEEVTSR